MRVDIALRGSVGEPLRNGEPGADRHEQIGNELEANQAMAPFDAERQSGRDQRHEQRRVDAEKSRDVLEELVSGATGRDSPVRQQPDDRRAAAIGCDAVHPYDSWAMTVHHPCRCSASVARRTAARQWQGAA